jgi:putative transposase
MLSQHYPIRLVCQVLDVAPSTYYYRAQPRAETDLTVALTNLAAQWPTYGSRRLTHELRRAGWIINRKRVVRLMAELGLDRRSAPAKPRTTDSAHSYGRYPNLVKGLTISRPDQLWVADITYVRLGRGFVYLAILMDVFTRAIRGWHLSRHLDAELTLTALRHALQHHTPEVHHSDQGVQYAATDYVETLRSTGVHISMAAVGEPRENGYAERVMRTIKDEEVTLHDYTDYQAAYQSLGRFLDEVYPHKRIHSSLGYLTPAEFEAQWRSQARSAATDQ